VDPNVPADEWRDHAKQEIQENREAMKDMPDNAKAAGVTVSTSGYNNQELQYFLDNDINPYEKNSWMFIDEATFLIMFITLFGAIVASDIVAGEFTAGTIKMLMVRPHPRWRILLSKYVASLLFAVVLGILLFISSWIVGGLFFGFGGFDSANYSMGNNGEMVKEVASTHALQIYGL